MLQQLSLEQLFPMDKTITLYIPFHEAGLACDAYA